ncbi:MAG TPA: hypothetical protein VLA72_16070 [Anaerolineales bacterium]|nr:hypothetical protein [Anaerolineales bacterium]
MQRLLLGLFAIILFGCSAQPDNPTPQSEAQPPTEKPTARPKIASLPDLGSAPELTNEYWLNTSVPLRLTDLRGKVVLLEMWTFG